MSNPTGVFAGTVISSASINTNRTNLASSAGLKCCDEYFMVFQGREPARSGSAELGESFLSFLRGPLAPSWRLGPHPDVCSWITVPKEIQLFLFPPNFACYSGSLPEFIIPDPTCVNTGLASTAVWAPARSSGWGGGLWSRLSTLSGMSHHHLKCMITITTYLDRSSRGANVVKRFFTSLSLKKLCDEYLIPSLIIISICHRGCHFGFCSENTASDVFDIFLSISSSTLFEFPDTSSQYYSKQTDTCSDTVHVHTKCLGIFYSTSLLAWPHMLSQPAHAV